MSERLLTVENVTFELEDGWTYESVRDSARIADDAKVAGTLPWRCGRGRHRRKVIGKPHVPEDTIEAALALVASQDTEALTRCARCGTIGVRTHWSS